MLVEGLAHRHVERGAVVVAVHVVAGDPVLERIEPGHHRGQRRPAQRSGDVAALEDEAALRQTVEVRGLDLRDAP